MGFEVNDGWWIGFCNDLLMVFQSVISHDRTGDGYISKAQSQGTHHAALASKENRGLIQHHSSGDVAHERGSRLVPVGGIIEVNIGTPDFTVIFPAFPSCHEAVTKVDETPQSDKRKKNGLFQAHAVGPVGLLFEDACLTNMGTQSHIGFGKKHRPLEVAAFELGHGADLAVVDGHRAFGPDLGALGNHGGLPVDATARIDLDPLAGNVLRA